MPYMSETSITALAARKDAVKTLERLKRQFPLGELGVSINVSMRGLPELNMKNISQTVGLAASVAVAVATVLALVFRGSVVFAMASVLFSGIVGFLVTLLIKPPRSRPSKLP